MQRPLKKPTRRRSRSKHGDKPQYLGPSSSNLYPSLRSSVTSLTSSSMQVLDSEFREFLYYISAILSRVRIPSIYSYSHLLPSVQFSSQLSISPIYSQPLNACNSLLQLTVYVPNVIHVLYLHSKWIYKIGISSVIIVRPISHMSFIYQLYFYCISLSIQLLCG